MKIPNSLKNVLNKLWVDLLDIILQKGNQYVSDVKFSID